MEDKIHILITKLWASIDSTIYKKYPLKKAKQYIKVKAEIFMPDINTETMQALLNFAETRIKLDKQQEELTQALFKQRYQIPENENKFNSCTEELHEIDEEENNEFSN